MARINIMALRHSAFYSPLLLTICGGFLQQEGLEPHYEMATADRTIPATIRSGETHLAQLVVAASFAELEQGKHCDIVHFAQINERDGFFIAGRAPDPDFSWEKLIGKQVLVDHLFQPLAMLRYALYTRGIDFSCIEVIDAGDVDAIDRAFRDGQGDYVHQQGPAPQQLAHDDIAYPLGAVGDLIGPVAFSSLCASREWIDSEMATAFMHAYRKARLFAVEAPAAEIAALEADFFPAIDRQVLQHTIADYQRLGCWSPDSTISRAAYDKLLDIFLFNGLISKRHAYESCVVAPPGD